VNELLKSPAHEMARAVRERDVGPVELVDALIARIERLDPILNAFVVRRFDEARAEAAEAERAVMDGRELGPLHGVPFTAKEAIAIAGTAFTNGSRLLAGEVSIADAPAVRNLRAAGAIPLGKTNVPEFCLYYDTDNDLYGRTRNPHDPERTPGGSSGGEGAAIAACMSPLGVGSDLGSSIRNPAGWNGIFGLKPSRELVSNRGHAGFGLSPAIRLFSAVGPLARSAEDLALALEAMSARPLATAEAPRTIAVYEEDGLQPVAAVCCEAVRRARSALADAGHELVEDPPPAAAEARGLYDVMIATEAKQLGMKLMGGREGELSRYGRSAVDDLSALEPSLDLYLEMACRLEAVEGAVDDWLERHPVAICPITPVPAPVGGEPIATIDGEPAKPGGKMTLATLANAAGLPAAAVPVMRTADGLPVGVQLIGRRGRDDEVLAVARELDELMGGWLDPEEAPASAIRAAV
jgi:aspartyl-tRNA(Asn)/glutamyl-tRNA(Gln) amidotransferase subunit A